MDDFVYAAFADSKIVAVVVDDPQHPADVAEIVSEWIMAGLTVEHLSRPDAVAQLTRPGEAGEGER